MKILLQRVWELRIDWDDFVPEEIQSAWTRWRSELSPLYDKYISRCYFPKNVQIISVQLHGFSDNHVHVSLVMSKTKVSPMKRHSIPRLELCGAQILARLHIHVKDVLQLPMSHVFAWTDSTIMLNWLSGNSSTL